MKKQNNKPVRFTSLEALRQAYGLKPVLRRTSDKDKLASQREKFLKTCKCCKQPLTYLSGTNVLACCNPDCKGIEMKSKNEDGSINVWYIPVTRILDEKGMEIAMNLFD